MTSSDEQETRQVDGQEAAPEVEAQRRRFAGGSPAEDVEGHRRRFAGGSPAEDVEAHGVIIEADPGADAAQHAAPTTTDGDDVESHSLRNR